MDEEAIVQWHSSKTPRIIETDGRRR